MPAAQISETEPAAIGTTMMTESSLTELTPVPVVPSVPATDQT